MPLGIAFLIGRRAATRAYTYGYGEDRFFPADLQHRVTIQRPGIRPDAIDGGHAVALSHGQGTQHV